MAILKGMNQKVFSERGHLSKGLMCGRTMQLFAGGGEKRGRASQALFHLILSKIPPEP